LSIKLVKRYVCVVDWRNKRKKNGNRKEERTWTTNDEKDRKKKDETQTQMRSRIYAAKYIRS